jgi:hypothetical protein
MDKIIKSSRKCINKLQTKTYKNFNKEFNITENGDDNESQIINLFINTHGELSCPLNDKYVGNDIILNRIIFASSGCIAFSSGIGNVKFINKLQEQINLNEVDCISSDYLKDFNNMVFNTEKETSGFNTRYMDTIPALFEEDSKDTRPYPKLLKHSLELQEGVNINNRFYEKLFTPFGLISDNDPSLFASGIYLLSDFKYYEEYDFKKEIEHELLVNAKIQFRQDNYKDYDEFDPDDEDIFNDTYKLLSRDEENNHKILNYLKGYYDNKPILKIIPKGTNLMENPVFIEYIHNFKYRELKTIFKNGDKETTQVLGFVFLSELINFFIYKFKNIDTKLFNIIDTSCEVLQTVTSDRERRCLIRDMAKSNIRGGLKRKKTIKYKKTIKRKKTIKHKKTIKRKRYG